MADCELIAHQFMDLTVPEYAYMFGFLQADGHLQRGAGQKGKLSVEINARDVELLRKFQKLTPYYSSITERTRSTNFAESHNSAAWTVCSLEARTKVNELGLPYGPKSKTISPPSGAFSSRDYLRGIIDADGSVGYTKPGLPFISLTTASTDIAAYLCFYARELTGTERNIKRNERDDIYNICYWKEQAQELAADLYYPGCLSLQRKQTAADSLALWVRPAGMKVMTHRRWKTWEDRVLLEHSDAASAAVELDRTVQSCSLRLWRLRTGRAPKPDDK
ncbi:LAGLIDADG family homing endonuclease [Streptomyces sp. CC219B]|uniref:LAGLIDADG family homing endonuclease n=1 Tax=Streptomyces sp. CC219B TaxID=3044574 RepID=UPI0024A9B9B7|nr:LAGLIDADG family homing endonuclease [Streptomyces sp. CC219B]